jgi:hypothetical protein
MGFIGPAKAVPLLQNRPKWSFSAACKAHIYFAAFAVRLRAYPQIVAPCLKTGCTDGFQAARSGRCRSGDLHDSRSGERRYKIAIGATKSQFTDKL